MKIVLCAIVGTLVQVVCVLSEIKDFKINEYLVKALNVSVVYDNFRYQSNAKYGNFTWTYIGTEDVMSYRLYKKLTNVFVSLLYRADIAGFNIL